MSAQDTIGEVFRSSQAPCTETADHLADSRTFLGVVSLRSVLDGAQDSQMLFFQRLKVIVKLLMPRV